MHIDRVMFRNIAAVAGVGAGAGAGEHLSADDARALVAIARIAVDADDREDADEVVTADDIVAELCEMAAIDAPPPMQLPRDNLEREALLRKYAEPLRGRPAGELAYLIAYIVSVSDFAYQPEEIWLVEHVRDAVGIDQERAGELTAGAAEFVTPE